MEHQCAVYMLECADKTLYIGSTKNLERRIVEHNGHKLGAKYTRARRPVTLVYHEAFQTYSEALKREHALKKLTRKQKMSLIHEQEATIGQ
jgi:putative endonuclease